jgi:two-component system, NtrC family, sensor histidine kinase PilS
VRLASRQTQPALKLILDPRRLIRWVYIGRMCLAVAIFIAAISSWSDIAADRTLVASLVFALSTVMTVLSAVYSEIYRKPLNSSFLYAQAVFDLAVVTAVIHVTNGVGSPFPSLYILVIATSSLLVPAGGGLFVAAVGLVFYFIEVVVFLRPPGTLAGAWLPEPTVWLQITIIAIVALVIRYLSAELRATGEGTDQLVAALQRTRLQAEDILRNIRSGVVTVDIAGRLLYANPTSEQLLGVELADRIGEPILDVIGRVAPELSHAIRQAAESKIRTTRGELFVTNATRRLSVGVTTTYTDHDDDGGGRTATAIFQDISNQKRLEVLKLRAERLEGIAELSASLAHEIRNPLASIRSAVEQISRMPAVSDDHKTLSGLVMRESDRLSRLLSEFLDFARVRVARTETVDLGTMARSAASLVAAHPDRPPTVQVSCDVAEGEAIRVEGDEDLLHRAIFNLALNAVQASNDDGEVRVEVVRGGNDQVPPGMIMEGDVVTIRVSDNGPGIPSEIRDRMFDPFFTTKANGSGLGLAVVHRAIEAHRGIVFVDSGAHGTRFTVILPSAKPVAMRQPGAPQPAHRIHAPQLAASGQGTLS